MSTEGMGIVMFIICGLILKLILLAKENIRAKVNWFIDSHVLLSYFSFQSIKCLDKYFYNYRINNVCENNNEEMHQLNKGVTDYCKEFTIVFCHR